MDAPCLVCRQVDDTGGSSAWPAHARSRAGWAASRFVATPLELYWTWTFADCCTSPSCAGMPARTISCALLSATAFSSRGRSSMTASVCALSLKEGGVFGCSDSESHRPSAQGSWFRTPSELEMFSSNHTLESVYSLPESAQDHQNFCKTSSSSRLILSSIGHLALLRKCLGLFCQRPLRVLPVAGFGASRIDSRGTWNQRTSHIFSKDDRS